MSHPEPLHFGHGFLGGGGGPGGIVGSGFFPINLSLLLTVGALLFRIFDTVLVHGWVMDNRSANFRYADEPPMLDLIAVHAADMPACVARHGWLTYDHDGFPWQVWHEQCESPRASPAASGQCGPQSGVVPLIILPLLLVRPRAMP